MFRRIALCLCAAAVISLSSCQMTEIPTRELLHHTEVPPKMMFLGDSIPAGYGLEGYASGDNYHCQSYSNILKERYETELENECGHEMINKAVSGATSQDFIDLLQSGELDKDLKESDAVVVSIGGNDLLGIMLNLLEKLGLNESGDFDSDGFKLFAAASAFLSMDEDVNKALEGFDANLKIIAEELNNRTEGTVYIQTLYDPLEYFTNFSMVTDFSFEKLGKFNAIIKENAVEGYTVIDVAADFRGKAGTLTNISNFDIHPNKEGHQLIAEDVDKAFRATGFTYTTTEVGEKRLTPFGRKAIGGGLGGSALLAGLASLVLVRRKKK